MLFLKKFYRNIKEIFLSTYNSPCVTCLGELINTLGLNGPIIHVYYSTIYDIDPPEQNDDINKKDINIQVKKDFGEDEKEGKKHIAEKEEPNNQKEKIFSQFASDVKEPNKKSKQRKKGLIPYLSNQENPLFKDISLNDNKSVKNIEIQIKNKYLDIINGKLNTKYLSFEKLEDAYARRKIN